MIKPPSVPRKRAFKASLALAGQTVDSWCAEQGVTKSHLYQVLRGRRESARLTAAVDAFIAKHAPSVAEHVA